MARLHLPRNFNGVISLEETQFQVGEISAKIEDYLNTKVELHYLDTVNKAAKQRASFRKGDLVVDLQSDVATLQQWDGVKLVPFAIGGNIPGSVSETADINATEDIPARSLVTTSGKVADSSNLTHFGRVVGISIQAVRSGFIATLLVGGEASSSYWAWTPNQKLFLNGTTLSTIPPTTGFSQFVALTRSTQTIIMKMQPPVLL